jgi:hypothetical protein
MQGCYVALKKTFSLGFEHIEVNKQNLIFIPLHLIDSYSINAVFTFTTLFQSYKCNIIILFMSISRGAWNVNHRIPTD